MDKPIVLYLDDEVNNLLVFEANVRRHYRVLSTTSADEAFKWLEQEPVSIVVADQVMPAILGTEFLAEVQKKYPHIPRILLTGYTSTALDRKLVQYLLNKPWEKQVMLDLLEVAITQQIT